MHGRDRYPDDVSSELDATLGRFAVEILSGRPADLDRGAELAAHRRLGGLFAWGLSALGIGPDRLKTAARESLHRAARQEVADDLIAAREIGDILAILDGQGLRPVVLKGRSLAISVWPRPAFRPAGDLDLFIEEESFNSAVEALVAAGYRTTPDERPSRFRVRPAGVQLIPAEGRVVVVDLHSRLFRTVGRRLDTRAMLARSRPMLLDGHPVRDLDAADRLLFLLVHAAKHAVRRLKWLLDLHAVALRADARLWREAATRVGAGGVGRPFFAAASLATSLPGVTVDVEALESLRPPLWIRKPLKALINEAGAIRENDPALWERYALELLFEPSMRARARMAAGLLVRLASGSGEDRTVRAGTIVRIPTKSKPH